ncbi:MAG: hypothetical protein U0Y08_12520 [Bacteroidia bacterium]
MKRKLLWLIIFQLSAFSGFSQTDTVAIFSKSYNHEANKDYVKAIEALMTVYNANAYPVNLRLGWLWYLKGDYAKSQIYYKNAITVEPKSVEARLGYVYPAAALENWTDVAATYKEILTIDPENSIANYRMAYILHYINKDNATAMVYINKVLKYYPFDFDANFLAATIQTSLGNIREARNAAMRALQYNPQSKEALRLFEGLK